MSKFSKKNMHPLRELKRKQNDMGKHCKKGMKYTGQSIISNGNYARYSKFFKNFM